MPEVYNVAGLVSQLRRQVEEVGDSLWVRGEVSHFKSYGHWYFSIKDEEARLDCVMWKSLTGRVGFTPETGMLVLLQGMPTVYVKEGRLQLVVQQAMPAGEGALHKAFEALKRRLEREGLFAPARKRALPGFPAVVGVVTSGQSAAYRDIVKVLGQRYPAARIVLRSVRVQGPVAAAEIAGAINEFSSLAAAHPDRPDVLIVGRGGGAAEDLWAFNEEVVARALFACTVPTITGIGHETDVTIADYVADCRASTPSNAAELAVPAADQIARRISETALAMHAGMRSRIRERRLQVRAAVESNRFARPVRHLNDARQDLDRLVERLAAGIRHRLHSSRSNVSILEGRLGTLDPRRATNRGYVRVEREGRRIRRAVELYTGDEVGLRFVDGEVSARVLEALRSATATS